MPYNMLPHILKYLRAEKDAGFYILIVGAVFIALSIWFWWCGPRLRGMAISLAAIAIVEIIVGGTLYLRTDKQIDTTTEQYYTNRDDFERSETARMDKIMSAFSTFKAVEIALLIVGLMQAVAFRKRPLISGIGMGLVVQAAVMLGFDIIAAQRAAVYLDALSRMSGS